MIFNSRWEDFICHWNRNEMPLDSKHPSNQCIWLQKRALQSRLTVSWFLVRFFGLCKQLLHHFGTGLHGDILCNVSTVRLAVPSTLSVSGKKLFLKHIALWDTSNNRQGSTWHRRCEMQHVWQQIVGNNCSCLVSRAMMAAGAVCSLGSWVGTTADRSHD